MYNIQKNSQIVVACLKAYNIRRIVISPGCTHLSLAYAVQKDPFFKCYSVADERSAAYFAIGLYLQTGEVVAITCTSAQATRNYIPGLTEAFYKHVPLLAITTSKLEKYDYQEYMQHPDQCTLPKDAIKKSVDLHPVVDEDTRMACIHKTIEAILELKHNGCGPVQINMRISDSLQNKFVDVELPTINPVKRYMAWDNFPNEELKDKKILIAIGEHRPFSKSEQEAIEHFCKSHNAAVYINHLSNYKGECAIQANLLLATGLFYKVKPDIVITIGEQTGDYPLYGALLATHGFTHWRVNEDGKYVDTYNKLSKIFQCPIQFFFEKITTENKSIHHGYLKEWQDLNSTMNYDVELPFSNLYTAQQLYKKIPANSIMNFAILNSIRCWSYFPIDRSIEGFANVSAFGIDGCNSMLIGESIETDKLCFISTGDLAFFYDMNSLGIKHIRNNVRILLINNNCGVEMKIFMNGFDKLTDNWENSEYITAQGHYGKAKGWAENCGFKYLSACSKEEFNDQIETFVSKSEKPIVFEVFVKDTDDIEAIDVLLSANKPSSSDSQIKKVIKSAIGEKGVKIIKDIIKK